MSNSIAKVINYLQKKIVLGEPNLPQSGCVMGTKRVSLKD